MAWVACISAASTAWPMLTFGFLLFPSGRLPSRRWRPVALLAAGAIVTQVSVAAFRPGPLVLEFPSVRNPVGIDAPRFLFDVVAIGSFPVIVACVFSSAASVFVRLRRGSAEERQQLKWVAYAALVLGTGTVVSIVWHPVPDFQPGSVEGPFFVIALATAFGVAIFKYRLYDIDVVISKTVIFGALAAFITSVYIVVVVGLGTAIGSQGEASLVLSILGAATVAVVFQPVRARVERLANRLVYGVRAGPYEVLSRFSQRLAATVPSEDLPPQMARLLVEGTGVAAAEVYMRIGDRLRRVGRWPEGGSRTEPTAHKRSQPAEVRRVTRTVLVEHHGEILGALAVQTRASSPLSPPEEKLLTDLAGQAGLVLRNVRLIEDLRASRERLVTARDAERQRLERDIRERVECRLAFVAATLAGAADVAEQDEREVVTQLRAETKGAISELQDLARGIYPALLVGGGLLAALEAQARTTPVPVSIAAESVGRYAHEVEAAAYFCCLEALQNVAKHAHANRVVVTLTERSGRRLQFTVDDDGVGFDPREAMLGAGLQNMADRVSALGGVVQVRSTIGRGTTIVGWLPTSASEPAP
jgi:signal transduction histidine kinase